MTSLAEPQQRLGRDPCLATVTASVSGQSAKALLVVAGTFNLGQPSLSILPSSPTLLLGPPSGPASRADLPQRSGH